MNVLIIEDEELAQEELVRIIENRFLQMNIAAILCSVADSVKWLSCNDADLIFMDIHLSDGICFDIFKEVDVRTPIIFTTAYEQYAINAFKVNGIGYLLKPIVEDDLAEAVGKLENSPFRLQRLIEYLRPSKEYKSRIVYRSGDRIDYFNIDEVAYFFSEDRLTFAVSVDGKKRIVDYTIESLEPLLDPRQFFRITRGCIASIHSIDKVYKYFNSRLKVELKPSYEGELLVSRVRVPDFMRWLDGE